MEVTANEDCGSGLGFTIRASSSWESQAGKGDGSCKDEEGFHFSGLFGGG